jgi:mono/diheme cytochrome c family protein
MAGDRGLALGATLLCILLLAVAGCRNERETAASTPAAAPPSPPPAPPASTNPAAAAQEAEEIFSTRCVTCHGPQGAGDGPASAGLTPKPRNFRDGTWQESVSDAHIENIIRYGGAAVGKSAAMPANPDLTGKPAVVAALREHVRSLRQD